MKAHGRRRRLGGWGALLVLAGLGGGCAGSEGHDAPDRYNLVLVSIDTLRADHLGCYGYERDASPGIDALAAQGVLFERAFSQSNVTAPSHMTIMTGLPTDAHGTWNLETRRLRALPEGIPTLASILRRHGYRTHAVTDGANVSGMLGFDRGFETYEEPLQGHDGGATEVFRRGREIVDRWRDERFFLFLHTYEVHDPYLPPERFRNRFADPDYDGAIVGDRDALMARVEAAGASPLVWEDWHGAFWSRVDERSAADRQHLIDLYDAGILHTDRELRGFVEALYAAGLRERTVVVLLSDHGEEFQEHGQYLHRALYQEILHVPLIFLLPPQDDSAPIPSRRRDLVRLLDVAPTVLDLLGLPDEGLPGRALFAEPPPTPELVFSRWPRERLQALRVGRWKLIRSLPGGFVHPEPKIELFDLARDPGEQEDLSETHAGVRKDLLHRLRIVRAQARDLGARYGEGEPLEIDADQEAALRALGYLADDAGD